MSTRGAIGIRKNGIDKIGFNNYDSYPSGLGNKVLNYIRNNTIDQLSTMFDYILLDNNSKNCAWNKNGFSTSFRDSSRFLNNSLFCEYAYIINLDTQELEVYIGFNKNPNESGRYAKFKADLLYDDDESPYYGVKLLTTIKLEEIWDNKQLNFNDDCKLL